MIGLSSAKTLPGAPRCPRRGGARSRWRGSADRGALPRAARAARRHGRAASTPRRRRRAEPRARVRRGRRRPRAPPDVRGADVHRIGVRKRLRTPPLQLRTPPHRVLELRAVRLHGEGDAGGGADRRPEQHVVREHGVGRRSSRSATAFRSTYRARSACGSPEELRVDALVAVEHEDRQQPADVGTDDRRAADVVALRVRLRQTTVTPCPERLHSRASRRV